MIRIRIHRHDARWTGYTAVVRKAANAALQSENITNSNVTIVLSNDGETQTLNAHYRGKNKPTNVLSFPDGDADETGAQQLGDIIVSVETITREAAEQGKEFAHHLTHLVIHGILHLLGYDHENARDAKAMESREIALLAAMGIANPYT